MLDLLLRVICIILLKIIVNVLFVIHDFVNEVFHEDVDRFI